MDSVVQTAYGLQFSGLPPVSELTLADQAEPERTLVMLSLSKADEPSPRLHALDAGRSVRRLQDGRVLALDRQAATAAFYGPPLDPGLLAHPYLGPVATTFSRWAGRESFHAGAFVVNHRAWVVLGPRTAGKSTLLAALAARQLPVLSDDIVITDGRDVFAGPRCIDLREPLPDRDAALARAREDSRWRMLLPPISAQVPLGGWIYLGWGLEVSMQPLPPRDLIRRLAAGRACVGLASDPSLFLALASLPSWELERPKDWNHLDATLDEVTATVGASA